jgi:hypothetical protein
MSMYRKPEIMWKLVLAFCFALAAPISALASDCGAELPPARIEGGAAFERKAACEGLRRATNFLRFSGFEPSLNGKAVVYRFEAIVRSPCQEASAKGGCLGPRVAGLFDAAESTVTMTMASEPWMKSAGRTYFGLKYDDELYTSVLAHESTHALNKQFYAMKPETHAQDEYIAYASQLWSMNEKTRKRVLDKYPEKLYTFSDELNINDLVHYSGPHAFGVMSYRHFMGEGGGRRMLARIYSGDYKPPSMDMP